MDYLTISITTNCIMALIVIYLLVVRKPVDADIVDNITNEWLKEYRRAEDLQEALDSYENQTN